MKPAIACDLCSGSGWIAVSGTLDALPCQCQGSQRKRARIETSGIPRRYIHCTLQNFVPRGNAVLARAQKRMTEFVDCWPVEKKGLLLMGGCGTGKTHLAVAALQQIIDSGKPGKVLFSNFQDLIQEIQASFSSEQAPSKSEILQPLREADLLVLDELGSQKPTTFVQEILYYIINSRYNDDKTTIFTTNYLDEPQRQAEERLEERIGPRLRSRLHEMCDRVLIESEDYRRATRRTI